MLGCKKFLSQFREKKIPSPRSYGIYLAEAYKSWIRFFYRRQHLIFQEFFGKIFDYFCKFLKNKGEIGKNFSF